MKELSHRLMALIEVGRGVPHRDIGSGKYQQLRKSSE